jgi:hypothetical protein
MVLFAASVTGMVLLAWKGQFFVTLSQRSNVETLLLAFMWAFFGYVALLSRSGFTGGIRMFFHESSALWVKDRAELEQRKAAALGPARARDATEVALNICLYDEAQPGQPVSFEMRDEAGSVGTIRIDGARARFQPEQHHVSNNVFAYLEQQINEVLRSRGRDEELDVLAWKTIDDERAESYLSMVQFARNLEQALGSRPLWPTAMLDRGELAEVERRMSLICRPLRNEGFLPDWEYAAEHKVPVIPEPLAFASLSRTEARADPLATMGLAAIVVVTAVAVLSLFIIVPPWVPG